MSDSRNFAALDWVVHEIVETLRQAREALEAYVGDPKDEARLRFCLTHIHQVHGSLQMVEFYGAAMMAEEMESLTQAMLEGRVASSEEAQEVLMRAILQFPIYLEKVKSTRRDNPLMVLPLLNDLRTVRGESLLTETNLFSPYLAPAHEVSGARLAILQNKQQFQEAVRKLRQMYQYAAAGFIRGVNTDDNLAYLKKVFSRLYKLTSGTARQPLWQICLALAEALEIDAIESSVSIKNLLRQLDKELKVLLVHGTKALDSFADDELIKNLLYYVARSGKHAPGFASDSALQQVYELYELDRALPEGKESGEESRDMLSAPDAEAMRSVVTALKAELDIVKQALDVSLAGGDRQQTLAEALPVIKRVADTMAVLGIGDLRKQVLEQGAALELVVNSNSDLSDDELMSVAGKVLDIESRLDSLAAGTGKEDDGDAQRPDLNLSQAQESVLRESRSGLEQAKDAIIEYIASQWDKAHLQQVPATLRAIRGGLEIIPMARPARIIGACARYVEEQLLGQESSPEWSKLDTLADAITSVEYYLERFNSERAEDNELLLGVAEDSVAQLGYAVAKSSPAASRASGAQAELNSATDEVDDPDAAALAQAYESALSEPEEDIQQKLTDAVPEVEETEEIDYSVDALAAEVAAADAQEAEQELEATPSFESQAAETETESAQAAEASVSSEEESDDEFDEEILEIFIEEAGEVSETIAEYFPRWAQNFDDQESLTEFRRAFHTLKGSGRMVGAQDIGELAWSIENMLNRIIDNSIKPSDALVAIIEKVRLILPDMIEAFRTRQSNPHPQLTQAYAEQAGALAKGETPADLDALVSQYQPASVEAQSSTGEEEEDEADGQLWEIFGKGCC